MNTVIRSSCTLLFSLFAGFPIDAFAEAAQPAATEKQTITPSPFNDYVNADKAYSRGDYAEAAQLYRSAAKEGFSTSFYKLGIMHELGQGVDASLPEAMKWYKEAAGRGILEAAEKLDDIGFKYHCGHGVSKDYSISVQAYLASNTSAAKLMLGEAYALGRGTPYDLKESISHYSTAFHYIKHGYVNIAWQSCDKTKIGDEQIVQSDIEGARQEAVASKLRLAFRYATGVGVSEDLVEADKLFKEIIADDAAMSVMVGDMYAGSGHRSKALEWYHSVADKSYDAQFQIGYQLDVKNPSAKWSKEKQTYISDEDAIALQWYQKAAENGSIHALNNIGVMAYYGRGTESNPNEAFQMFKASAEGGNREAMRNLAVAYSHGVGVEKDEVESEKWRTKMRARANATSILAD